MNAKNLPRPYTSHIWTEAMIARLRQIYNGKLSATDMAAVLNKEFKTNFTRNAIIGKSHRLKLVGNPEEVRKRRAVQARKAYERSQQKHKQQQPRRLALIKPDHAPLVFKPVPVKTTPGTLLVDLQYGQCRWPINDPPKGQPYLFCDHAALRGQPYCPTHSRIAYNNPRKAFA